jgi:hypothetical protein
MKRTSSETSLPLFAIVLAGVIWGLLSFYFGVIFGLAPPGQQVPQWYMILGYIFDGVARLGAAWLCLLNWRLPQIISDRNIWLLFALRSGFYFLGSLLFGYWELVLKRSPDVSLADPLFVISFLCLLWGMLLAVKSRQVNLQAWQWVAIVAIAVLGIWLGWISSFPSEIPQPVTELIAQQEAPRWVIAVEEILEPWTGTINLLYVASNVFLLVLAGTLVLTFWGGRFSRTWTLVALAALISYIADIRYAYIITRGNFETGGLLDTFWVLSAILLGIGAALEYDISTRPRQR